MFFWSLPALGWNQPKNPFLKGVFWPFFGSSGFPRWSMVIDRVRWWFGRAKPGGGDQLWIGGCFGRWVSSRCCVLGGQSLEFWFWRSKRLDSKSPGLGSRKPQKPGPLGGVGVGCRLRRVIRFYRTLTTVWTCEAKKPRWPKISFIYLKHFD